jgi:hypothetical protein
VPGIPARDVSGKGNRYVSSSDLNSDLIAQGIAEEIRELTGKTPYVVMASTAVIPWPDTAANANGIDAIQFEFGVNYRQEAKLESTIKRAAKSIVAFYDGYLKPPAN